MRKSYPLICLLILLLLGEKEVRSQPLSPGERAQLSTELEQSFLQQLLQRWYPRAIDETHGGFLTSFAYNWQPTDQQDKMIVTQARHTWLPAKAAQLYPELPHLEKAARQGFRFLRDQMWDPTYGGFYTWVTREGKPIRPEEGKTAYGNAFGIYALATFYQTYGDTAALHLAERAFRWLERAHDLQRKGYFQHLQRNGSPMRTDATQGDELSYKDQNSSIHLLEAFTALYQVWPDSLLRQRLSEMFYLIRDTITTPGGNLTLFLTPDWQPISYRDSAETVRKAHQELDHLSFGHDIETAYLLLEAAHVLGIAHDSRTHSTARRMLDQALQHGWDRQRGGFYEKGYMFKGSDTVTIIDDRKNWWAQAEGLNTLLLMADEYPSDAGQYGEKFRQQWRYIRQYLIDPEYGGWYEWGADKNPERTRGPKGHAWKAAYHDGRSLMNCLLRLRPDKQPPSAPTGLTFDAGKGLLRWKSARDNRHVVGYLIYQDGQQIGYTPGDHYVVSSSKPGSFSVRAVDASGNVSSAGR